MLPASAGKGSRSRSAGSRGAGVGRAVRATGLAAGVAAALLAPGPGTVAAQTDGAAVAGGLRILALGQAAIGFDVSAKTLRFLEQGRFTVPDTLPFLAPPDTTVLAETLSLGPPRFRHPLPGPPTDLLLPDEPGEPTYITTRRGLVRLDGKDPGREPELLLPGWDLSAVERMADGRLLILERTYDEEHQGAIPPHLFLYRPGASALPDTALVCSAGAKEVYRMPGDTLFWLTRIRGRTLDRVVVRDGRWESKEIVVVPKVWNEWDYGLGPGFVSPRLRFLLVEHGRGMRPRLLELDESGRASVSYVWKRGVRPFGAAYAPEGHLLVLNGVTNFSVLDTSTNAVFDFSLSLLHTSVFLTPDGHWILTSGTRRDQSGSDLELRRRGAARLGRVALDEEVTITALVPLRAEASRGAGGPPAPPARPG